MTWQTQFSGEVVYRDDSGLVLCGNALDVLKGFPDNSISCVVTSPPYFHLRKYIVLDPFGGTCRTGYVAAMLGRKFVMIEGKPEYIETIAKHNLAESCTGVPAGEQRAGQKALFER